MLSEAHSEPADCPADAPAKGNGTGKIRMLTLDDVDRRTRAYRATIELRDSIYSDRGGRDRMSVLEVELADSLAVQCAMIRDIEARWLQGEEIDLTAYATMLNARRREATQLGVERVARNVTPDLRSYIEGKAA